MAIILTGRVRRQCEHLIKNHYSEIVKEFHECYMDIDNSGIDVKPKDYNDVLLNHWIYCFDFWDYLSDYNGHLLDDMD